VSIKYQRKSPTKKIYILADDGRKFPDVRYRTRTDNKSRQGANCWKITFPFSHGKIKAHCKMNRNNFICVNKILTKKLTQKKKIFWQRVDANLQMFIIIRTRTDNKSRQGPKCWNITFHGKIKAHCTIIGIN
jgi:hypothetical protein